ncbi:MAG: SBBP repeat-containing protein [Vicingaceae bacterium]
MKIKLLLFCLTSCLFFLTTQAQNFDWARSIGGNGYDFGNSIKVDASGNIYTTGHFEGTVDFDPGAGTTNLTSSGSKDVFVQKLDPSGNFVWAKSFGGSSFDNGVSIQVDASGNIYTLGGFQGTVDFDPGAGTTNLTSAGNADIFVQKLDPSGNFIWAKSFGGSSFDTGFSITVDASGNVFSTGRFIGITDFDPGAGTANLTSSSGGYDVFVQKLDASGNFLWAKSFGGYSYEVGHSITIDASGNVYTTGLFNANVDFDPGTGTSYLSSNGSSDIFIQKLDASGNFIWAKSFGGSFTDIGYSNTVDASGNVYSTGRFVGTVDFDPGAGTANLSSSGLAGLRDVFVQKLDPSGNFLWAKSFGGSSNDEPRSITVDASGNVYTLGYFQDTIDFDPGAATAIHTSAGTDDIFIHKMSQVGTTGILELSSGIEVKTFPNPTTGLVQISFAKAFSNVEITLTNIQGQVVFTKQLNVVANKQINIEGSPGIYFLNVRTEKGQSVIKLVKE